MPLVGQTSLTHILFIKDQEKMIGQHLEVTSKIQLNWPNEGLQALWNRGRAPTGRAPETGLLSRCKRGVPTIGTGASKPDGSQETGAPLLKV